MPFGGRARVYGFVAPRGGAGRNRLVAALVIPIFLVTSCVTTTEIERTRSPIEPRLCTLTVSMFTNVSAKRKGLVVSGEVPSRLFRLGETPLLVGEFRDARWSVDRLEPGRYRLDVFRPPAPGAAGEAKGRMEKDSFTLRPGDVARLDVVLTDRRPLGWTSLGLGIGAVVVAIVAIIIASIPKSCNTTVTTHSRRPLAPPEGNPAPDRGPQPSH